MFIDAYVTCQESKQKGASTNLVFPDDKHHQKAITDYWKTVISYTKEEIDHYKNPICLVSFKVKPNYTRYLELRSDPNESYYMASNIAVQFSHDI